MRFSDIPGKIEEKKYLQQRVDGDSVPHALLFKCSEGGGGLAMARAFVQYLLCSNKENGDSCGHCSACVKQAKSIHPDVHFAFPVIKADKKKREDTTSHDFLVAWRSFLSDQPYGSYSQWLKHIGAEDKSANLNTKECNNIIKTLGLKSFESPYKIQIVWCAEHLGKNGNRLLKLIEEPPDNTIIILLTTRIESILNTIISRCQLVNISSFQDADIETYLRLIKVDADHKHISFLANGNMSKALELANGHAKDYSEDMLDWMRRCYQFGSKPSVLIQWVEQFSRKGRAERRIFLEYCLNFFKEYMTYLNLGSGNLRLNNEEKQTAERMSKIIDLEKVEFINEELSRLLINLNRNAHVRIACMDISIKIHRLLTGKSIISDLIY